MRACHLLVAATLFCSLATSSAANAKCKKGERLVLAQSPVLGGPGLGYETVTVVDKASCFKVLQTSPDGSFALVQLEAQKAGWIATGLVDATLSNPEDAKEVPVEGDVTRVLVREQAVRTTPRFDAEAGEILPANAKVKVEAKSADGQWLKISSKLKKRDVKGWIIRFATAEKAVEEGAKPSAGSGAWTVGQEPKVAAETVAPDDDTKPKSKSKSKKIPPKKKGEKASEKPDDKSKDEEKAAEVDRGTVIGRTSAIYFGLLAPNIWVEQYRSDAVGDVYHAYDIQSLGAGFYAGYSLRSGSHPFVLDIRTNASVNPFMALELGNPEPVLVFAGQGSLESYFGWRFHQTESVDVDMGLTPAIATILNPGFGEQSDVAGAFASNVYLDILRPTVTAHSRMGGAGMMALEVSATVGTMLFLPDPGATYAETNAADRPPLPVIGQPPVGEEDPVEPDDLEPPLPLHLAVGANGRIRYAYPMTDSLLLDVGATLCVRQAIVRGPGLRTGSYLQANQVDVSGSIFAGITFGL